MNMPREAAKLPVEPMSDQEIVRRVVGGDSARFEILMRRHNQRVYRTVRAVLGGEDDVEDVMQQAYLNAYSHLHQFHAKSQFSTWLTRIAVNEAIARRRKRGAAFAEGDDALIALVDTAGRDPEQHAVTAELRGAMEAEIAALPDSLRVAFMLREIEEMSTAEAAESLAVSEDVVKTRLHRARSILRERLYRRAGVTLDSVFVFGKARCDAVVAAVLARIAALAPRP